MKKFYFTIITSTYNCGNELLKTADSIKSQNRDDIQWILKDGNSSESTIEIINKCIDLIDVFICEKDDGIYDAWNKSLIYIKGEWVIFLGAGDIFYSASTLDLVNTKINECQINTKLIYGKLEVISKEGKLIKRIGQDWNNMYNKWEHGRVKLPVHPEVLHHNSLFKLMNFDTNFKIVGDSDFLIRAIKITKPHFIDLIITKMLFGGTSQDPGNDLLILDEIGKLNNKNKIKVPLYITILFRIRIYLKKMLFIIFGNNMYNHIRNLFKI